MSTVPAGRAPWLRDAARRRAADRGVFPAGLAMPVINPSGLFHGDRLQNLSLMAYLHWPFLFVASNGFGRLEIAHHLIVSRLGKFAPSEADFLAYVQEYADAHLLFLYQAGSKIWGAWDTDPKFLPHWKTAEDRRSPEPPEPDYTNWLREYRFADSAPLTKSSKDFQKFFSGIGVGVGIGDGKNTCASPVNGDARMDALPADSPHFETTEPAALSTVENKQKSNRSKPQGLTAQQESWFAEWWNLYWLHKAKLPAQMAFGRAVKTAELFQQVMAATRSQKPEMIQREAGKRPHGATWLNQERWTDVSDDAPAPTVLDTMDPDTRRRIETRREAHLTRTQVKGLFT